MIPDRRIAWLVTESIINHAEDKEEWLGTTMTFDILVKDNKTQLRFTHLGLDPSVECFDNCSNAWTLIKHSLHSHRLV